MSFVVLAVLAAAASAATWFFLFPGGESESERVARASDAANTALQAHRFEELHALLAGEVRKSITPQALRTRFDEAEAISGVIVAVERVSTPIVEGQTATVETVVTYEKREGISRRSFYDLFVLEDDAWLLVYSQPKEDVTPVATPLAN